jgi:pSer/pThr/pTyr-binding forkhead associated (FHA) protein
MPRLVLLSEGMTGRTYDLTIERTTVGRVDGNAFTVAEPSISSRHCEILMRGPDIVVKDLNSTNGTFINNEQVKDEAVLKPGQILRLGTIEMRLESGDAPAQKKAVEHTMIVPQGVKFTQGEMGNDPKTQGITKVFKKKSDKSTKLFLIGAIVVVVIIVAFIAFALTRL